MILSLSFRIILTNVTFVTTSVASLILDSSCFVFGFPFSASTLGHVSLKCCFEVFVALSSGSEIFCRNRIIRFVKLDPQILADLLHCFFFWTCNNFVAFFIASKTPSLR
jgi:hypothetical protein